MIRFLKLITVQILLMLKHAVKALLAIFTTIFATFFGRFKWQAPAWLRKTGKCISNLIFWSKRHLKITAAVLVAAVIIIAAGIYGHYWYVNQPKPYMVAYSFSAPTLTNPNLTIRFQDSVAPLNMINQPVTKGITMSPFMAGEWYWANDHTLQFKPETNWPMDKAYNIWPINTLYEISLDEKNLLKAGTLLEKYKIDFSTPYFELKNFSAYLYHDPTAPEQKKAVATMAFSHPLNRSDFEKLVAFELSKGLQYANKTQTAPEFYYSEDGREVYIHSALLATPLENSSVTLFINKGIAAQSGGNKTSQPLTTNVDIPGLYQLTFSQNQIFFADNEKGEPEPVLAFESSHPVADEMIKNQVTAWLLPPKDGKGRSWDIQTVTEKVLEQSQKIALTQIESDNPQNTMHAFKFKVPPGRQMYVQINAGVRATGGYIARNQSVFLRTMPDYPTALSFLSDGALLNLTGDKDLGIMARGIPGARVEVARILPRQLHILVDQLNGSFTRPRVSEDTLSQLVERSQIYVPLSTNDPAKTFYTHVNLADYLDASAAPQGIFVLYLGKYNPQKGKNTDAMSYYDISDTRFIVITDLGIIAKTTADNSHEVFVQSISTGEPVSHATVEVYGVNGLPVISALTDENGRVHFDNLNSLTREKRPLMYVVTKDTDQSFLPIANSSRKLDFSRFPIDGLTDQSQPDQLNAYLFTDRGLYRPGETAHIATIVRPADWVRSLEGLPVRLIITDPRGRTVQNDRFNLSAAAFNSIDFTSGVNAPAGTYTAELYLLGRNYDRYLSSVTFSVRDFEPDRMKVSVQMSETEAQGWLKPEQVTPVVTALHLFGAPASDRRVAAEINVRPAFPAFAGYHDYRFYLAKALEENFYEDLEDTYTDENGQAALTLWLDQFDASAYSLNLLSSVFEAQGGRNVKAQSQVMVSEADYLVGVKTPDPLDFINKGALRKIHWIALGQDLKPMAVNDLTCELVEVRYVSVLVKREDGTYRYESRRKDSVLDTQPFALGDNGFEQDLKTGEPGNFLVNIKRGDILLNQVPYMVAGNANTSRALDRNAELQLNLNKTAYTPGEEIEISIRAPYTGAGLITIEREKVYNHVWFVTNTTSSVQRIRIPEELEGNAYVNVQFVRAIDSEEIYMSPLSYGVAAFNISLDKRRINVDVSTPAQIEPGDTIPIKVNLNRAGHVVVYGVDEGILQVARYKQPKPLEYFFRKRALEVGTAQILDLILPEFSLIMRQAATGGDDESALGANLNPFKRKNKPPVVWWSGIQEVPAGETTFEWQVPDYFNGQLHFFAVAVDERNIGITQSYAEVRGPVVLTPNMPFFVTPGDVVKVSTGIFNNLPQETEVKVRLETGNGLKADAFEPVVLNIASLREGVATFDMIATDTLGSADLVFVAELPNGKEIRIAETTSVRPAVQHRVQLDLGIFTKNKFELALQRTLYPQLRKVQAGVDSSPLVWGSGLEAYLENYAYSCTEQLLSKAMPALIWGNAANKDDAAQFNRAASMLRQRQNSSGGFGVWEATPQSNPFISLYAADFLIEAKERGFSVSQDLLDYVNRYLSQMAKDSSTQGLSELRNRAYAIYLLTRQGVVTSNQLSSVRERLDTYYKDGKWHNDITAVYMAAAYKMLHLNKDADTLIKKQPWLSLEKEWRSYDDYFDTLTHDAQYLNLLIKHFPERFKEIPADLLASLGLYLNQERYNSLSSALLVRALDNYGKMAREKITVTTTAKLGNTETAALEMLGQPPRADISTEIKSLIFDKTDSRTPAFYLLTEAGYDLYAPTEPINQGLELIHDYLALDGTPVQQVSVGDEFLVRLRLRSMDKQTHYNVAIVDLLPGGVEAVYNQPAPMENENSEYDDEYYEDEYEAGWVPPIGEPEFSDWSPNYIDMREDRMVLYGTFTSNVQTFTYRVRATNAGQFVTPPAFAQSMYQTTIMGQGLAGKLTIAAPAEQEPDKVDNIEPTVADNPDTVLE